MSAPRGISFKTRIGLLSHLPGMHYIELPKEIIKKLGGKLNVRLICTVNRKLSFQCGVMALGEGRGYISITKKRMKEIGVTKGDPVHIQLTLDRSRFGMEMAEELAELLKQDKEGRERFEKLTPGKQRYVIHYVGAVKNPELRLERAMLLIGNLKRLPLGKENFREMLGLSPRRP